MNIVRMISDVSSHIFFFPRNFPDSEVFENAEKRRQMAEQEVPRDKWVVEILETETSW